MRHNMVGIEVAFDGFVKNWDKSLVQGRLFFFFFGVVNQFLYSNELITNQQNHRNYFFAFFPKIKSQVQIQSFLP